MAYTVFFREGKEIFTASNFISQQPVGHRDLLQAMADALAINGQITHPLATKNSNGEWSVLLKENGDVYMYTLFVSRIEQEKINTEKETEKTQTERELVIIDPGGRRDSIGGYHPGFWSINHYASLLGDEQRKLFFQMIDQIQNNTPSEYYHVNSDRSISIHIHKQGAAYTVSVVCRAEWR